MPLGGKGTTLKINIRNSELSQYFVDEDPDSVFFDQREIGHGSFGAVYYVSQFEYPLLALSPLTYPL